MTLQLHPRQGPQLSPGDILVVIRMRTFTPPPPEFHAKNILDDFDARSPDELTLRKADHIQLVELDNGFGDGWYLGRHLGQGVSGLFPGGTLSPSRHSLHRC